MEKQKFSPTLFDRMTASMNIAKSPAAWLAAVLKEKPDIELVCITHEDSLALPDLFTMPGGTEAWIPKAALPKLKHLGLKVVDRKFEAVEAGKDQGPQGGGAPAGAGAQGAGSEDEDDGTMSEELQKLVDTITDAEAAKVIYDEERMPNKVVKEWAAILGIAFGPTDPVKGIREQVFARAVAKFN